MKRRSFTQKMAMGAMALPTGTATSRFHKMKKKVSIIRPSRLKEGDAVGLIAPSSAIRDGQLKLSIDQIERLGLRPVVGNYASDKNGFLAGTDAQRVEDIESMFSNEKIKAIWCIRGGYGLTRIVSQFRKNKFIKNPKLLIGYSDVTCINQYLATLGLVSVHGQISGSEFTEAVEKNLRQICFGGLTDVELRPIAGDMPYTIQPGQATGRLTGGNLSLLSSMVGTPYLDSFKDKLVFIEDVGERPYRVDRMLTQLIQGTDLCQANGIILGQWADCEKKEGTDSFSLREVLTERLAPLQIPCSYGLPFGHVDENLAMPLLVKARFDATRHTITFLEDAMT